MKTLVIGASGQVGRELVRLLSPHHEVLGTGWTRSGPLMRQLDLGDESAVRNLVLEWRPDVVFIPGGITNVDYCEDHRSEAYRTNALGPFYVARACHEMGSQLVHFSTDYVFDGEQGFYSEGDVPNPVSVYAFTKLEGERLVLREYPQAAVLRTAVVYSYAPGENNFYMFLYSRFKRGESAPCFTDQRISPTWAPNLAEAAIEVAQKRLSGLYHAAGSRPMDRYAFGVAVTQALGYPAELARPVRREEVSLKARRVRDSSLCIDRLQGVLRTRLLPPQEVFPLLSAQVA